ncbi:MAG: hypothetical protein ACFB13_03335 [Kiloniellaceae bacterium]
MIDAEPPAAAVAPLPVWPAVAETYRLVFGNIAVLAKISALPFVLMVLIGAASTLLDPLSYRLAWEFGTEIPWTLMAVAWLRHLLLAPGPGNVPFFPKLQRRHLHLLGYALLLSVAHLPLTLFPYIADFLSLPDGSAVYWVLYLPLFYIGLRFSFIYAATAVDENYSLAVAWRHTRGIARNLFIAAAMTALVPGKIFDYLLGLALAAKSDSGVGFAVALLWHAGMWVLEALYLALFAVAFRTCTGWVPAADKAILERFE